jgi:ABC-type oligopeptide transport system substrate-binding subunit
VVASQLRQRGWKVDVKVQSVRRTLEQLKGEDWDLTLIGFSCPTGEGLELYEFAFAGDAISSGGNFSRFEDHEVEQLIEQARCALDPADRLNIEERIGDRLVRELPWIPMIVTNRWAILHGKVKLPNGLPQRWCLTRLEIGG